MCFVSAFVERISKQPTLSEVVYRGIGIIQLLIIIKEIIATVRYQKWKCGQQMDTS